MAVTDNKVAATAGIAKKKLAFGINPAAGITDQIIGLFQVPHSFLVERFGLYCSNVTDVVQVWANILRPGKTIQGVTLAIGTTKSKFQISAAFDGVSPTRTATGGIPAIVHKATEDEIIFSSVFTIGSATAHAGGWWGAIRVQMDVLGNVSTKVCATNQQYVDEPTALAALPPVDAGYFDLGSITIHAATTKVFTARTTLLDSGDLTAVKYNGVAAGLVEVQTDDPAYVDAQYVYATMTADDLDRAVSTAGGLIVFTCTTTAVTGAVVDGVIDLDYRVWPCDGEVAVIQ